MQIFTDSVWQMSLGERAALEGVLNQCAPRISIEIGTTEGGSLARVAAHSSQVHSFDLVEPELAAGENVTLHTGDSHALLPAQLSKLSDEGLNVDFALVDGDHSSEGVRRDVEDLLNSEAVAQTVILIHDINNETVRAGLDAIHYAAWPKVAVVELDFVPGYIFREEALRHELWGGLGLIVVDSTRLSYSAESAIAERYYPAAPLFAEIRDVLVARDTPTAELADGEDATSREQRLARRVEALEHELLRVSSVSGHHQALWEGMMDSVSWKATAPIRAVAAGARRLTGS